MTATQVHEALSNGTFDDLIANVPDEFHPWIRQVQEGLTTRFIEILGVVQHELFQARFFADAISDVDGPDALYNYTRKELADQIVPLATYPGLCFALEDGKDIAPRIWQMIRPERSTAMILEGS